MVKIDLGNEKSRPKIGADFQMTPLRRTLWAHFASIGAVLITQVLLGITQDNDTIVIFGLGLVAAWMMIEATQKLAAFIGLPLTALTIATALEVNQYPNAPWILLSLTTGLAAWDTYHLLRRSNAIDHVERSTELEGVHLRRLFLLLGVGTVAGITAMLTEIDLGFGLALILGLLAIFGIGQTVRYLRKNSN